MAKERRKKAFPAIALRGFAALMALWLLCAVAMTIVTAYMKSIAYGEAADDYNRFAYDHGDYILERWEQAPGTEKLPGAEYLMISTAQMAAIFPSYYVRGFNFLKQDNLKTQTSVVFYDADGNELVREGNYLCFGYTLEHTWELHNYTDYAYISVDSIPGLEETLREKLEEDPAYPVQMRFTGTFDGIEFIPIKIEFDLNSKEWLSIEGRVSDREWETIYEAEEQQGIEYVTIYANNVMLEWYSDKAPVRWGRERYDSLADAISARVELFLSNEDSLAKGAFNSVNFNTASRGFGKVTSMAARTAFLEDDDNDETTPAPVAFYMVYACEFYPLRDAIYVLKYVYIFMFAAAMLIGFLVLRSIKRNLAEPLSLVCRGISDGWGYVSATTGAQHVWHEPYEIARHYHAVLDKLSADKNEIARLTTALEYAREAEEQRRQMSSNIAHELKTPLAVIRSYAEGLQEHIAEEKRDKYLEVIVGETERMDELVLEMLELSRLEAGRVKLARDVCDLSALTHSVFEKLEPAAEAKELTITYELQKDCLFSADEARILQVIGNFASNALRYTPVGGHIWVRTSMARGYVSLAVENTSPHLSDEVLSKVWERFWRAEEARSEKSSGLGLAIAKSIVELHGGKCSAENTEKGVEFSFTI